MDHIRTAARRKAKTVKVRGYKRKQYRLKGRSAVLARWDDLETYALRLCKNAERIGVEPQDCVRAHDVIELLENAFLPLTARPVKRR